MHSSNHKVHYKKYLQYLTRIKHGCTSAWRVFNGKWVTNKGQSALPSANYCQGQLQTPQYISVLPTTTVIKCTHSMICHHLYRPFTAIICAERSDTETSFSPRTPVFPCQKHSSTAPCSFTHLLPLFAFSILCFSSTPVHCGPWRPVQSPSIPSRLRPLCAKWLFFSMSANPPQPHQPYHFVIFLFSFFRPFWLSLCHYFLAFFRYWSFQYFHTILIQAIQ